MSQKLIQELLLELEKMGKNKGKGKRPQNKNSALTLYLPLKLEPAAQKKAKDIVAQFRPGVIISPPANTHFFRVVTIPKNKRQLAGIVISSIFDGTDLDSYLKILWGTTIKGVPFQTAWADLCKVISDPPASATSVADFQNYAQENNLNTQSDLSYGYEATTDQIVPSFPPERSPQINPLSLFVPFKQGLIPQATLHLLAHTLNGNQLPSDTLIHFAMVALIPNSPTSRFPDRKAGLLLITCYDQAMDPYLGFFWGKSGARAIWAGIVALGANTPKKMKDKVEWAKSEKHFTTYINDNDWAKDGDLSGSYTASLPDIFDEFPIP
jgi:hypothetical protein